MFNIEVVWEYLIVKMMNKKIKKGLESILPETTPTMDVCLKVESILETSAFKDKTIHFPRKKGYSLDNFMNDSGLKYFHLRIEGVRRYNDPSGFPIDIYNNIQNEIKLGGKFRLVHFCLLMHEDEQNVFAKRIYNVLFDYDNEVLQG
ncbi:MAG: hypothetical protein Q8Q35_04620 [Nanoarchaeota archaeon]|nr:hypothetical protein [Nanoarchaeota archaeon]